SRRCGRRDPVFVCSARRKNCLMKTSDERSDSRPSATKDAAKCDKCGATGRLNTGICVSCLLLEGLETGGDVSKAAYGSVLDEKHRRWPVWIIQTFFRFMK